MIFRMMHVSLVTRLLSVREQLLQDLVMFNFMGVQRSSLIIDKGEPGDEGIYMHTLYKGVLSISTH